MSLLNTPWTWDTEGRFTFQPTDPVPSGAENYLDRSKARATKSSPEPEILIPANVQAWGAFIYSNLKLNHSSTSSLHCMDTLHHGDGWSKGAQQNPTEIILLHPCDVHHRVEEEPGWMRCETDRHGPCGQLSPISRKTPTLHRDHFNWPLQSCIIKTPARRGPHHHGRRWAPDSVLGAARFKCDFYFFI